jgi:hypothetical protein
MFQQQGHPMMDRCTGGVVAVWIVSSLIQSCPQSVLLESPLQKKVRIQERGGLAAGILKLENLKNVAYTSEVVPLLVGEDGRRKDVGVSILLGPIFDATVH